MTFSKGGAGKQSESAGSRAWPVGAALQKSQMLYEISILAFKMVTAHNLVAISVSNIFFFKFYFISFAVPGLLLTVFVSITNY